jgi:periplasmic protein TorT
LFTKGNRLKGICGAAFGYRRWEKHMKLNRKANTIGALALAATLAVTGCGAMGGSGNGQTGEASGTGSAQNWSTPAINTALNGKTTQTTYTPIAKDKISKQWKICVLFPHLKDSYWAATNYGTLTEAQRDNVEYSMFEAGGYTNLDKQLSQMQDCINGGYDAIILGAINATGVCTQVAAALEKKIPVVDFINGTDCPESKDNPLFSHALVSFYDLAETTAKYIIDDTKGSQALVGFFPGPEGAGWSDAAVKGFQDTIKGTNVKIVEMRRADPGLEIQQNLIEDTLKVHPEITHIVGVDIAAEAGVNAVRNANMTGKVDVYAFDIIPPVYDAIVAGDAVGSPTDFTTVQGRMAIDQAVRMLEGEKLQAPTSGPVPKMITQENAADVPYNEMFAPRDFKTVTSWTPNS